MNCQTDQPDIFEILTEFIEISIHSVLYIRKLYPETIFTPKKKYGIAVFQIIHPEVRDYITQCLKAVLFHLKKGQLKKVFIYFENDEEVFEKLILDVVDLKNLGRSDPFLSDLEQSLRGFLLKLYSSQFYLTELPSNATFSVQLETTRVSSVEFNQEPAFEIFPWIEKEPDLTKSTNSSSHCLIPVQSINCDNVKIQMYIQKEEKQEEPTI